MKFKKVLTEAYSRCPKCTNHTLAKVDGMNDLYICDECGAELKGTEQYDHSISFTDYNVDEAIDNITAELTWENVYDEFSNIIDKYFPNEAKIEIEVRNLYNAHKGEDAYEIAYKKWCEGGELDESVNRFDQLYHDIEGEKHSLEEGVIGSYLFNSTLANELYDEFYRPITNAIKAGNKEQAQKVYDEFKADYDSMQRKRYAKVFFEVNDKRFDDYQKQIDAMEVKVEEPVAVNEDYLDTPEYAIQRYEDDIPELFHHIHDGYMTGMVNAKAYADALRTIYSTLEELNYLNEGKEEIKVDNSSKQILTEKSWKYQINKEVAFKLRDALEADATDYDELKAAMSAVYDEIHRLVPDYFDEDECQEKKFDLDMLPTEDDEDADFDDPEYMDEDEIESEWNYALEDIWDMCDAFNIWLPIRGLDEDVEGSRNKRPHVGTLFDIVSSVKVNGPKYRGGRMPQFNPFAINEMKFPDNMRPKHFYADIVDDNIQFTYYTQEPFTPEDTKDFITEVTRFFKGIAEFEDYGKPFKVLLNVQARDGKEYGNLVYDIDITPELEEGLKPVNELFGFKKKAPKKHYYLALAARPDAHLPTADIVADMDRCLRRLAPEGLKKSKERFFEFHAHGQWEFGATEAEAQEILSKLENLSSRSLNNREARNNYQSMLHMQSFGNYKESLSVNENIDSLPSTVTVEFTNSEVVDEDYISEYLCNKYEYCPKGFTFDIEGDKVVISDIEWDLNEGYSTLDDIARDHGYRDDRITTPFKVGSRVAEKYEDGLFNVGTIIDIKTDNEGVHYQVKWDYSDRDEIEWLYYDELTHWVDVNESLNTKVLKESILDDDAKKILTYIQKHPEELLKYKNYEECLDELNLNSIFFIPKSAPGFEAKDEKNISEKEAEKYINLILTKTNLKDELDKIANTLEVDNTIKEDISHNHSQLSDEVETIIYNAVKDAFEVGHADSEMWKSILEDLEGLEFDKELAYKYFMGLLNDGPGQFNFEPEYDYDDDQYDFDDDVEQDRMHAALYGGDRTYCDKCGAKLIRDEWGGSCPNCDAEQIERDRQNALIDDDMNYQVDEAFARRSDIDLDGVGHQIRTLLRVDEDDNGNWIDFDTTEETSVMGSTERTIGFYALGETKEIKGSMTTKGDKLHVQIKNGSEGIFNDENEIADFIKGEFGIA